MNMDEINDRINEKIFEIETYLEQLESILPSSLENYKKDFRAKLMGERSFEKIVESIIDLGFFIINKKQLKKPETEEQTYKILYDSGIISEELSKKLSEAKGMRNIIVHRYGEINDELVFRSLSEELIPDVQEFINKINKILK